MLRAAASTDQARGTVEQQRKRKNMRKVRAKKSAARAAYSRGRVRKVSKRTAWPCRNHGLKSALRNALLAPRPDDVDDHPTGPESNQSKADRTASGAGVWPELKAGMRRLKHAEVSASRGPAVGFRPPQYLGFVCAHHRVNPRSVQCHAVALRVSLRCPCPASSHHVASCRYHRASVRPRRQHQRASCATSTV